MTLLPEGLSLEPQRWVKNHGIAYLGLAEMEDDGDDMMKWRKGKGGSLQFEWPLNIFGK